MHPHPLAPFKFSLTRRSTSLWRREASLIMMIRRIRVFKCVCLRVCLCVRTDSGPSDSPSEDSESSLSSECMPPRRHSSSGQQTLTHSCPQERSSAGVRGGFAKSESQCRLGLGLQVGDIIMTIIVIMIRSGLADSTVTVTRAAAFRTPVGYPDETLDHLGAGSRRGRPRPIQQRAPGAGRRLRPGPIPRWRRRRESRSTAARTAP
jgi:hypothetical protein